MAHQLLDDTRVGAGVEEIRAERYPQGVQVDPAALVFEGDARFRQVAPDRGNPWHPVVKDPLGRQGPVGEDRLHGRNDMRPEPHVGGFLVLRDRRGQQDERGGGVEDEIPDLELIEFLPPDARLEHQQVDDGPKGRRHGEQPALLVLVQGAPEALHEPRIDAAHARERNLREHALGD